MAETVKNTDNGEIRGAQTNPAEPANASGVASPAQMTIAENSARQGNTDPTNAPGGAAALEVAAKEAGKDAAVPAASSTQAGGGAVNVSDKGAAATGTGAPRDKAPLEKQDAKTVETQHAQAAATGVEMFKVTVDGVSVQVPKGTLAIEACFRAGADVPYFCYHPRLTSVGACRMCIVSIELEQFGARRAANLASCTIPIAQDNVVIQTQTPDVKKAQNGILEFLLANHPLDCPVCDRGGECPLQNMTVAYGPPVSRFIEEKRHYVKAVPLSDYVILDRERCIQCMRCTRFTEEISGDSQLTLINRGASTEIGTFYGQEFSSNFSGNTIEICPVGALTSRPYRFAARPWDIRASTDSICAACGNGCNVVLQGRLDELVRVNARTNEDINEEWSCDRGKFGQYYVNDPKRLKKPLIKTEDGFEEITWDEALRIVADKMRSVKAEHGADALAALGSPTATVEENYLLSRLMRAQIGTNNIDYRLQPTPLIPMQSTIADIENFAVIASVGFGSLDFDQPIVFLRVHKAVSKNGATWLKSQTVDSDIQAALREAGDKAVLLVAHNVSQTELAAAQSWCSATGAKLNVLLPDANSWGAARAGALPDRLPGGLPAGDSAARAHFATAWNAPLPERAGRATNGILMEAASGVIQLLYVMGSDPATKFADTGLAVRALDAAPFVVVSDMFLTETAKRANIVLPAASFAEKDGTFVNIEGREQKIKEALRPKGDSRPDWRILADLLARLGTPLPYFSARDIYREYARALPK